MKLDALFPILSGVIALATAWIGYKAAVAKAKPGADAKRLRVQHIMDPTVRVRSWKMHRIKWFLGLPSVAYNVIVAIRFRDNPGLALFCIVSAVALIIFLALLRDKPQSRTLKTAEFRLAGSRESILEDCRAALERIGARVGRYDPAEGIIEAGTEWSWRSFGEIVTIVATQSNPDDVTVRVTSDAVQPTAVFDFGANALNIRRLKAELIG